MLNPPLGLACTPTEERYRAGEPIFILTELRNLTDQEATLLAAGVPWQYHHAIEFEAEGFDNRLWVIDPPDEPDVFVGPGETVSGVLDLAQYLYRGDQPIHAIPGTHQVRARSVALASIGNSPPERFTLESPPFTVVVVS